VSAPSPAFEFRARHVLADLYGIEPALLNDADRLCHLLEKALTEANATVLRIDRERFPKQGVSVFAVLSESHASLHTVPEHDPIEGGACFVDFLTCGQSADPEQALHILVQTLQPTWQSINVLNRGLPSPLARAGSPGSPLIGKAHP
jgi:S-adenosylmethionine decarboxylase